MADVNPKLRLYAAGAEAASLPDEFVVIGLDDGTDIVPAQGTAAGDLKVTLDAEEVALAAGTNNIGDVDVATMPADTFAAEAAALGLGVLIQGDDGTDRTNVLVDAAGHLQVDVLTGGGGPEDTDDDIVAGGQTAGLGIGLNYGWDGTQWERLATDASGSLDVNVTLALPAGANTIGEVTIGAATTAAGDLAKAEDAAHATGDVGVMALGVLQATPGNLSGTDGDYEPFQVSGGRLWTSATIDAALPAGTNNIGDVDIASAIPAGTNNIGDVDVATMPADTFVAEGGALGLGVLMQGDDGTDRTNVLVDTAGHLQVDVLTGGGADSPTNATVNTASSTNTAAAGSANLDSAEITEAEKLWMATVSAGVAFKAKIQMVENNIATDVTNLMFGRAGESVLFNFPHRDFAAHAGASAGTDVFRAVVTNMDDNTAADLHATFYYST